MEKIDIILTTCNRIDNSKKTIKKLHERIKTPFRLIVVDDDSIDGTAEYLQQAEKSGLVDIYLNLKNDNICQAYNLGFKHVKSEYFITMQDDITVPDLDPCVIQKLISLMKKYKGAGGIGCRIQRIPNLDSTKGNEDLIPSRKALSAYFRIQRKSDFERLGDFPFGNRNWDDIAFLSQIRLKLGKEGFWARNLWCDHSRGYCKDRGYHVKPRKWGMGIHGRMNQAIEKKPYPQIDSKTCKPLNIK